MQDHEKQDSQRRDRILHIFLCPEIGQFSPDFGAISLLNYTEDQEKKWQKSTGENSKDSKDRIPWNCRFSVACRGRARPGT